MNIEEKADKIIERFKRDGLLKEDASAEAMARFRKKLIFEELKPIQEKY